MIAAILFVHEHALPLALGWTGIAGMCEALRQRRVWKRREERADATFHVEVERHVPQAQEHRKAA